MPVTPETPRPSLAPTTSPAPTGPVRSVAFTEPVPPPRSSAPAAPVHASPVLSGFPAGPPNRPPPPPGLASNPQRAVKIIPRTGASIGDISAKPVTASIGTRLSVLSLSVVDKPYARPQLKPPDATTPVAQVVVGADANTVRAAAPTRVFSREGGVENAGIGAARAVKARTPSFREMPSGALTNVDPAAPASPDSAADSSDARAPTSRVISGGEGESDALSRFAAQMGRGGPHAPAIPTIAPIKPLVPAPRPMTATVPIVSPRLPMDSNAATGAGPNTVQLTIGFEIASLQLTPALRLGAVQIRPTSNIVSVQLDATSQATLQRLMAGGSAGGATPSFEIESLQLTAGGKIALITLAPKK